VALPATNVHCPGKEMHDHIAAAENGDSYDKVKNYFLQELELAGRELSCFL